MALAASCCCSLSISLVKVDHLPKTMRPCRSLVIERRSIYGLGGENSELFGQRCARIVKMLVGGWTFVGGLCAFLIPKVAKSTTKREGSEVSASCRLMNIEIASSIFNLETVVVLPIYALVIVAPKARLTKRTMDSSLPYLVLGLLYAYLLYLSRRPNTLKLIYANQLGLPKLPSIKTLFSREMNAASAWRHMLLVDFFTAWYIFLDGLKNDIKTQHSIPLCLLFCPFGIIYHLSTKVLSKRAGDTKQSNQRP